MLASTNHLKTTFLKSEGLDYVQRKIFYETYDQLYWLYQFVINMYNKTDVKHLKHKAGML